MATKSEKFFNRARFVFTGAPIFGKESIDTRKLSDTSEWSRTRLNFGVKANNDTQFLNAEFMHSDKVKKVKLFSKDNESFEVNLCDTDNKDVLDKVADFSKITVDLETDKEVKDNYYSLLFKIRNHEIKEEMTEEDIKKVAEYKEQIKEFSANIKQFAHMKDVIDYISVNKETISKHKIKVTGDIKVNYYNGKSRLNFVPKNFKLLVGDNIDEIKEELMVYMDIFFDRDSIDDDKKENKVYINGYVGEVVKKADKLFPTQVIFDYSRADLENEQQKALVEFLKSFFEVKSKKVLYRLPVICSIVNGAEVVEFDESQLTDKQRTAIALGLAKLEDYKPKGNIFGERINFIKVTQPDLKLSPEGTMESIDLDELVDYLPSDDSDKKLDDVKEEKKEEKKEEEVNQSDMMRMLFG